MPKHRKRLPEHTPDRVRDFIRHMLGGKPAREAAAAAGFEPSQTGALCGRPEVRAALQRERVARDQVVSHTAATIEAAMGYQGFADPAAMFRPDGSLLPIDEMTAEIRAAIATFEHHTLDGPNGMQHVVSKIRLTPRQPPLRDLAQMHGMLAAEQPLINAPAFNITINCDGPDDEPEPVETTFRRFAADGGASPPPGSFDRGTGQLPAPQEGITMVEDTPELEGTRIEAPSADDEEHPPPGLSLRERLSWSQARAARRQNERIDRETADATRRGMADQWRRRPPRVADGLDEPNLAASVLGHLWRRGGHLYRQRRIKMEERLVAAGRASSGRRYGVAGQLVGMSAGVEMGRVSLDSEQLVPEVLLPGQAGPRWSSEPIEPCRRLFAAALLQALLDAGLVKPEHGGRVRAKHRDAAQQW